MVVDADRCWKSAGIGSLAEVLVVVYQRMSKMARATSSCCDAGSVTMVMEMMADAGDRFRRKLWD